MTSALGGDLARERERTASDGPATRRCAPQHFAMVQERRREAQRKLGAAHKQGNPARGAARVSLARRSGPRATRRTSVSHPLPLLRPLRPDSWQRQPATARIRPAGGARFVKRALRRPNPGPAPAAPTPPRLRRSLKRPSRSSCSPARRSRTPGSAEVASAALWRSRPNARGLPCGRDCLRGAQSTTLWTI